jgi:hypothetical protein
MGWGEARITLLPPRWRSVENRRFSQKNGSVVRVIGTQRDPAATAAPIACSAVRHWLLAREFAPVDPPWLGGLRRKDVLAELFEQDGELSEVILEFGLSRSSPDNWPDWQQVVDMLCTQFGLLLNDPDSETKAPSGDLFRLLAQAPSWPEFSDRWQWPPAPKPAPPLVAHGAAFTTDGPVPLPHQQFKP